MVEIDESIDPPSLGSKSIPTQFSLRALLLLVLAVAVWLVFFRTKPSAAILSLGGFLAIAAVGWQRHFSRRFVLGLAIMVGVNLLPTYFTWKAFQLHGTERTGWPLTFLERGDGISIFPHWLLVDLAIAVVVAWLAAKTLKNGWRAFLHQLQTWGLEDTR